MSLKVSKQIERYFNILKDIPNEKWCTGTLKNGIGQYCALGHLGLEGTPESIVNKGVRLANANDGVDFYSPEAGIMITVNDLGSTPRERVLNALILADSGILEDLAP